MFHSHEDHALSGCLAGSEWMQFLDMSKNVVLKKITLPYIQLGYRSSKGGVMDLSSNQVYSVVVPVIPWHQMGQKVELQRSICCTVTVGISGGCTWNQCYPFPSRTSQLFDFVKTICQASLFHSCLVSSSRVTPYSLSQNQSDEFHIIYFDISFQKQLDFLMVLD